MLCILRSLHVFFLNFFSVFVSPNSSRSSRRKTKHSSGSRVILFFDNILLAFGTRFLVVLARHVTIFFPSLIHIFCLLYSLLIKNKSNKETQIIQHFQWMTKRRRWWRDKGQSGVQIFFKLILFVITLLFCVLIYS